ncbi:MAG: thioredoxin-disulfide reductase [Anaerolineales bacterium]
MTEPSHTHSKCLIVGSGPAGMSAALYAARANLEPIVLTGMDLGGQVANTADVENYPGFPKGIRGPELVDLFQVQAERFGAEFVFDTATAVDFSERPFKVSSYSGDYQAESLILATGASVRHLGVPGEKEFTGRGVSYCGTCDGHFFQEKDLIVVGGGDSALEEGIFLTRYAKTVTIVHRRDELRGGIYLENKARENPKISFMWDTIVTEIHGDNSVHAVTLQDTKTGEEKEHPIDGVFIFIGHIPNTSLFEGVLDMDESGYLVVDSHMHTNVPGVYAAGEVADPHFQQIVTSAGMGGAAAMEAVDFLEV